MLIVSSVQTRCLAHVSISPRTVFSLVRFWQAPKPAFGRLVVLSPTRELARQSHRVFERLTGKSELLLRLASLAAVGINVLLDICAAFADSMAASEGLKSIRTQLNLHLGGATPRQKLAASCGHALLRRHWHQGCIPTNSSRRTIRRRRCGFCYSIVFADAFEGEKGIIMLISLLLFTRLQRRRILGRHSTFQIVDTEDRGKTGTACCFAAFFVGLPAPRPGRSR